MQSFSVWTGLLTTVHEEIFGSRVPVDVHEEMNVSALQRLLYHFFHAHDLRRRLLHWVHPLTIEVEAGEAASVVAHDDAIRVEHRNNFENEGVSEDARFSLVAQHHFNDTFHNEGTVRLSRVDTPAQNDALAISDLILRR